MSLLDDEIELSRQLTNTVLNDVWKEAINWLDAHSCRIDRRWVDVDADGSGADNFLYAAHSFSHEYEYLSDTPPCNGDEYNVLVFLGPSSEIQYAQDVQSIAPCFKQDIQIKYNCIHKEDIIEFFSYVDVNINDDGIITITPLHLSAPILLKNVYEDIPKNIKFIIPPHHFNYIKLVDCKKDLFIDNCICIHEFSSKIK